MHIIVTGGAGFIGSNVAAAFLRDGYRVTVFDSLARSGSERNLEWLQTLAPRGKLRFARGDVRDSAAVRAVVGDSDVHIVFHFAAQTAVTRSLLEPREDLDVNLYGTHNVLEAVRRGAARVPPMLFFTSTNKVYGALARRRVAESSTRFHFCDADIDARGIDESEPLDFHSPYGCSKGAADQYVHDYARIYDLRTVVFRMSCIYGPRQFGNEDQGWVAHFMRAVAEDLPLTIYGNGKQVRDLLYIDDLVRAFQLASKHIERTAGNVYNMGGGPPNAISVWHELRPMLERLAGHPLEACHGAWRPGDQPIYVTNTCKAQRDFGWQPRVQVDEGLKRLWAWARLLASDPHPNGHVADIPRSRPGVAVERAMHIGPTA